MAKARVWVVMMLVAALWPMAALGAESKDIQNIVVIGWDGAQRDHVKEMISRNELPNLIALSREGKMVDIDVTAGATDTKAGWTQIWTGYAPDKTGVYSNGRYQPIPLGYSVFERVEAYFGPDKIDTVAVIGKKGHVDKDAPQKVPYDQWQKKQARQKKVDQAKPGLGNLAGGKVVEEGGLKFVQVPGKPWYNTSQKMDLFVNGLVKTDVVATRAMEELDRRKDHRFLFFIHFAEPDHAGHKSGEDSQEYSDALKGDDEWTGKIIAKLKALGLYEKTLVYIVVDHGFNEGTSGHRYAPYVFLATNDKSVTRDGDREDIAPTVLKRLGVDLSKISPPMDGTPLDEPALRKIAPAEKPQPGLEAARSARKSRQDPDSLNTQKAGKGRRAKKAGTDGD